MYRVLYSINRKVYFISMFNSEIRTLLLEVIRSWQVLAVCVVLVIYIFIVNYVARIYNRNPRKMFLPKAKKGLPEAPGPSESDELGLEDDTNKK